MESSLRSAALRDSNTRDVSARLMFTTSGLTAAEAGPAAPQRDGWARKSIALKMLSKLPNPSRLSTFAKRMCRTDGATPANRGVAWPLPTMVPATWVPWPSKSTHRSMSPRRGGEVTKLTAQMLVRFEPMSRWLTLRPVSRSPMGVPAPPKPANRPGSPPYWRTAPAPTVGVAVSWAAVTTRMGSTACTKSAAATAANAPPSSAAT